MAASRSPTHPPPAKSPTTYNPTYINCISRDILREIFLRLPSLGTLVRAACTCRAWRDAVVSSPKFRCQFRNLHPAPLLGLFIEVPNPPRSRILPATPIFFPAVFRDRDLVTVVRGGDFQLTSIQERSEVSLPGTIMIDSRHGYVLLIHCVDRLLTVFNPLLRWSKTFGLYEETIRHVQLANPQLVCSDEDPMSFRVVFLGHDNSRVRATVFSSKTLEWSILPWVEVPTMPPNGSQDRWIEIEGCTQANRFLYWVYTHNQIHFQDGWFTMALDTTTMEFAFAELPPILNEECWSFHLHLGEMKDTSPCIVYVSDFNVGVLLCATEGDGAQSWYIDKVSELHTQITELLGDAPLVEVDVVEVTSGFAYLAVDMGDETLDFRWLLSLCLETMELDKQFRVAFIGAVYPYIMAWPPANYGTFAQCDDA
ncbi:hypothetical protein BRADI_2g42910v3 [Brachypodium distachyon]|uniref:F-box domain-containing protein n=1 Tax=Brachypodium distachyon TaxID=15368 RepID=I1HP72_BRADI|nr:hypothetical protein BRADI_2g42910v3 [Brachypodium distachyon]